MSAIPKMPPKYHALKIWPEFFNAILLKEKRFEVRKDDRDFKTGDYVTLHEWAINDYTGRSIHARITYILVGDWLAPGYCAFGIVPSPGELERYMKEL